jgi:hypothetical protein
MRSCDKCLYFIRIRSWIGRIGICDFVDGSLKKVIKNCKNFKSEKYKRKLEDSIGKRII